MRAYLSVLMFAALATGCGGSDDPSPREACHDLGVVTCERIYACVTEPERMALNLPPTEAGCVTQFDDTNGCASATTTNLCEGNETFHPSVAAACAEELSDVSCSQFRDPEFDFQASLPACDDVCTP